MNYLPELSDAEMNDLLGHAEEMTPEEFAQQDELYILRRIFTLQKEHGVQFNDAQMMDLYRRADETRGPGGEPLVDVAFGELSATPAPPTAEEVRAALDGQYGPEAQEWMANYVGVEEIEDGADEEYDPRAEEMAREIEKFERSMTEQQLAKNRDVQNPERGHKGLTGDETWVLTDEQRKVLEADQAEGEPVDIAGAWKRNYDADAPPGVRDAAFARAIEEHAAAQEENEPSPDPPLLDDWKRQDAMVADMEEAEGERARAEEDEQKELEEHDREATGAPGA